jgi:peptide/nickel transport system permease protein
MGKLGLGIVIVFAAIAFVAPLLAPYHPRDDVDTTLQAPSARHLLGTDDVGRDIFSQVIAGSRVSLAVGLSAGLAASVLGLLVGLVAGYLGGWTDRVLMRAVDFFLALPRLPLFVLLGAYLGATVWMVVICFTAVSWAFPARMVRAQVLVEKQRPYVISARLSGGSWRYTLVRHVLPALLPLALAVCIMETSQAVAVEAGLSFLGLGDPTLVSWGTVLHYAFAYPALFLNGSWLWWALPPGICLSLLLLGLALAGMRAEEHTDPRLKGGRLGC